MWAGALLFEPEIGHELREALRRFTTRGADGRTGEQRDADALHELTRHAVGTPNSDEPTDATKPQSPSTGAGGGATAARPGSAGTSPCYWTTPRSAPGWPPPGFSAPASS